MYGSAAPGTLAPYARMARRVTRTLNFASLIHKRVRRQQARSSVGQLAARLGSLVRRRHVPMIPLAPYDDL